MLDEEERGNRRNEGQGGKRDEKERRSRRNEEEGATRMKVRLEE